MNETEWFAGADPVPMLAHLYAFPNGRKRRLFAVACCRRLIHRLPRIALPYIDVAEQYAEGQTSAEELQTAFQASGWIYEGNFNQEDEEPPVDIENLTDREMKVSYCVYRVCQPPGFYNHPLTWNEDAAGWIATTAPRSSLLMF